ncbi:thermonuclease family protein [Brucella intermedia]|uniref:Nuclease n=1 Tax=Brucella intermedia M86 TaxID=1234597 RepID=M5K2Y1_9HYPH|nr:thermonuclease family protein [Brucella intermedia]ELT51219.1 nuclease [Brucella intermedia M86]
MNEHLIVSILLCTLTCEPAEVRIWDGDSIRLGLTEEAEAIRIFNIDAPEIVGQCTYESDLAQQSKRRLAELMAGQQVAIERRGTDPYGRTLALVSVNGIDAGDTLVSERLARIWGGRRESWC